jgi:hypothetical protein
MIFSYEKNGSFIKSEDDTIINKLTPFEDYEEIGSYFEGVPSQSYDALFFHKESKTIYFFLGMILSQFFR